MLFKRFSRSRSNSQSQSYVDAYQQSPHDSKTNSASYDTNEARYSATADRYGSAPLSASSDAQPYDDRRDLPSSRHSNTAPLSGGLAKEMSVDNMYPRTSQQQPAEVAGQSVPGAYHSSPRGATNGYGSGGGAGEEGYDGMQTASSRKVESQAAPDLLMQAFNQALRPHLDKVDAMEVEIADLRAYIDQLEQQRSDVHAWIDKRGLRPGMFDYSISSHPT